MKIKETELYEEIKSLNERRKEEKKLLESGEHRDSSIYDSKVQILIREILNEFDPKIRNVNSFTKTVYLVQSIDQFAQFDQFDQFEQDDALSKVIKYENFIIAYLAIMKLKSCSNFLKISFEKEIFKIIFLE